MVTDLDRTTGPVMFWVSVAFLMIVAGLMFSRLVELPEQYHLPHYWLLAAMYPVFLLEWLWHKIRGGNNLRQHWMYCLVPPLRLGGRDHVDGGSIWLPRIGWSRVDKKLRAGVERAFSIPMIVIALMVLPLLGAEYYFHTNEIQPDWRLAIFLKISGSIIWLAFAVEFLVMLAIVDKKFRYCRNHIIDIAIICLPLISFLRVLRLGQVMRLHQLSRVGRVYRLRGLSSRLFRGLIVLEVVDRFVLRQPERRLRILREQLEERQAEVDELYDQIRELEELIAKQEGESVAE